MSNESIDEALLSKINDELKIVGKWLQAKTVSVNLA